MRGRESLAEALKKCSQNLLYDEGKQVHGAVFRMGHESDLIINNSLIDIIEKAHYVFDNMPERNVVSWAALMCGYVHVGNPKASLLLLNEMGFSDVRPNEYILSTNMKACGILGALESGKQIHAMSSKSGLEWYPVVGNSIIDMYFKCRTTDEAQQMFDTMPVTSLITWNAMIAGYTLSEGMGKKSLHFLMEMQECGEKPDDFTFSSTLKACRSLKAIREGKQIHAFLIRHGYSISTHKILAGALVDLYAQCGCLLEAREVFDKMEAKSLISWASLMILLWWSWESNYIHTRSKSSNLDVSVANSILDMYLKCGLTEEAEKLFSKMLVKNVVSYTVMITGYGKHGLGKKAVQLFGKLQMEKIEPDLVTYLAVLSACSHSGLVEESQGCFTRLCNDKQVKPRVEHYACMVDVLGRAGRLKEAKDIIEKMRLHKNVEMGREVGDILLRLDGDNLVNYVLILNMFADVGYWKECERLRGLVKAKGLKKEAGCSW
ncbi:hypothetical protein DH2020_046813 [Rehmannia glutinosa]|uniref:Pentatricopeptide repeat-containing protein n=1 Tax=Rehmannia glutinosa TaxID=99300 RepID=A0ABR0UB52_REHGL